LEPAVPGTRAGEAGGDMQAGCVRDLRRHFWRRRLFSRRTAGSTVSEEGTTGAKALG
jgi:hypothetical protein